ncbi:cytochrome P450 [Streptomyces paradoxus]|uniref:Cytochrome P450 n=1 Tax=Streptomyces paradoxus TaxID=66375 RepID=A0A7W9THT8_9ACTN|nr:cytochrome P450 [Streptomyces paradoxus]MBB6080964.1 cytochrome P450 [Streptomyces paradoxus]
MELATCPEDQLFRLDPRALDVNGEGVRLREAGRLVPAVLDGGIRVWATGHLPVAAAILGGRQFRKHPQHWADLQAGRITDAPGVLEFALMPGMLNEDGARHRELRGLVSKAFTLRRVESLRPRIDTIVGELIAELAQTDPQEFVDLRRHFAFPLPMRIICELFGLDYSASDDLARHYKAIHDGRSGKADIDAGRAGVVRIITGLIAERRRQPGDDLTSALIAATDGEGAVLDDELLLLTLMMFLFAGHETTQSLLVNALKALVDHPEQLELVRSGAVSIDSVVEETLRWASPINTLLFRYAAEDVVVGGVPVKKGDAIALCIAASGRDDEAFGPTADQFDAARQTLVQHVAFGHGAHYCIGAPLARLMARTALAAFTETFDFDQTGAPAAEPVSTYASNSLNLLAGRLRLRHPVSTAA